MAPGRPSPPCAGEYRCARRTARADTLGAPRARMERRASLSAAEREIDRIEVRRKRLIEMVMEGVPPSEAKDELTANAARREELKAKLAAADSPPPLLHP